MARVLLVSIEYKGDADTVHEAHYSSSMDKLIEHKYKYNDKNNNVQTKHKDLSVHEHEKLNSTIKNMNITKPIEYKNRHITNSYISSAQHCYSGLQQCLDKLQMIQLANQRYYGQQKDVNDKLEYIVSNIVHIQTHIDNIIYELSKDHILSSEVRQKYFNIIDNVNKFNIQINKILHTHEDSMRDINNIELHNILNDIKSHIDVVMTYMDTNINH